MTATTRYKYVKNTIGAPFTADNFINKSDGDDKQFKQVRRILTTADIGTAAGQTQNANGCIIESLPDNYNVIDFNCHAKRPLTKIDVMNMIPFIPLDNGTVNATAVDYAYGYAQSDNTIRVIDRSTGAAGDAKLKAGDVIVAHITLGVPVDAGDKLNTVNN